MAAKRWLGVAPRVAQITTITIGGTITIGDVFTIVCGYGTVTVVAATTGAPAVAAQIQAALAATTASPEFYDAVWTVLSNVVTGTSRVPGTPFVVTSSATGTSTAVTATPTAANGPNFADTAANYSGGTLPVATDTLTIEANSPAILYGLTGLAGLFAKVTIEAGSNAEIGLREMNPRGFREYRPQFLAFNMTLLEIGSGIGNGSQLIKLDLGAVATGVTVLSTGTSNDENEWALQLIGGASATLVAQAGSISIAAGSSDAANFASIVVGSDVTLKAGLTCTHTLVRSQGTVTLEAIAPTLDIRGGSCVTTGQVTTLDISAGKLTYKSASTITAATVGPGTLDCSDLRSRTITTLNLRTGANIIDPQKTLTLPTIVIASGCKGLQTF